MPHQNFLSLEEFVRHTQQMNGRMFMLTFTNQCSLTSGLCSHNASAECELQEYGSSPEWGTAELPFLISLFLTYTYVEESGLHLLYIFKLKTTQTLKFKIHLIKTQGLLLFLLQQHYILRALTRLKYMSPSSLCKPYMAEVRSQTLIMGKGLIEVWSSV